MEQNTLSDDNLNALNDELKAITDSLADVMIARKISLETMLIGIDAFLLALYASGHGDPDKIYEELFRMSEYYRSLVLKH